MARLRVTALVVVAALAWSIGADPSPKKAKDSAAAPTDTWAKAADVIDKLYLDGKVAEVSKTISDPATYRQYTELAYSMNPVDLIYYATPGYRKELVSDSLFIVARKVATIAGPVVGFEMTIALDSLESFMKTRKGKDPFKLTPELKGKFVDATKTLIGAEGKKGKVFDFVFVDHTANDAIAEIHRLSGAFRDTANQVDAFAKSLRTQQESAIKGLEAQVQGTREEIKRLEGLIGPEATADRKQEISGQVLRLQQSMAAFDRQIQLCNTRIAQSEQMVKQAEEHRVSAQRFDRIADGVKGNLPLLTKLADYLQKNKDGLPVTDCEDMIAICQEVGKRDRDWKGELEDLYEIYKTKGFGELLNMATENAMAAGGEAYEQLASRLASLSQLQTLLDPIKANIDSLGAIVEAGEQARTTYLQMIYWGELEKLRKAAAKSGGGASQDWKTFRDAVRKASQMADDLEKIEKKVEKLQPLLESARRLSLPSADDLLGSAETLKEIQDNIGSLEEQKKEILKYLEENSDTMKAWKWLKEKKEKLEKKAEEWKDVIEVLTDVVKLLDKDMPELDLSPDQEYKDFLPAWFGGKGTTYTGFAIATDATSGVNPDQVHLFWYDEQDKTNHEIKDIKFIPEEQVEMMMWETRVNKARIRYRFQPPAAGDYIIWGYVRDRAGHASCALANTRCSQESDHKKWKFAPESPDDRKILETVRSLMEEVGCNPDEVFRRRDFHQIRLRLKMDDTGAKIVIHEPYNFTEKGLDPSKPLRFNFEVEDPESWFSEEDVSVWITDEYGKPVWEAPERSKWQIQKEIKPEEKFRAEKTKMIRKAVFDVPEARGEGPGIYYACVQVVNGAGVVGGKRQMFFLGDKIKPWTLITEFDDFRATYKQGDQISMTHTFWNISDAPVDSVKLELKQTPSILKKIQADPGENTQKPIPTGGRERITGKHIFQVASKPKQSQKEDLIYECTLTFADQPDRKALIEVPINLWDEDADKIHYVKGSLHYRYQNEQRPVPYGTLLCISQVYLMPAMGSPKYVEQFIGYGEIGNEAGDFKMNISPVGPPPYRMRLVAKSQSREKDKVKNSFFGTAGVFTLETSRPFMCITPTFDVSIAKENVYRNNTYDIGTQVIPYYSGFMRDKSRRIPIPWEGELSTGGYISPYGHDFAQNPYSAYGTFLNTASRMDAEQDKWGSAADFFTGSSKSTTKMAPAAHGQEASVEGVQPGVNAMETGVSYLNFNGSLSILDTLIKGYRFSRDLRYLARDGSAYTGGSIPMVYDRALVTTGRPSTAPASGPTSQGSDLSKFGINCGVPFVPNDNFTYRTELIREKHIKENFYEEHDYVYKSDQRPPVEEYIERSKRIEEVQYKPKKLKVRVFVVADTKKNRVVELEPSAGTISTAIEKVNEPVSAEKLTEVSYLVCARGDNKVAIYRNGSIFWSCPKADKPDPLTILKSPEFAASTPGGTVLICDGGNHRILEIDPRNDRVLFVHDKLVDPVMAQLTDEGTYLVTDRGANQVVEIAASGQVAWSFGTAGKAGSGNLLKQPQSAMRISGGKTVIADTGNNRVIHVGKDKKIQRTISQLQDVKTDPQTGKAEAITVTLDKLSFAARFSGIDYLINGDFIYSVSPKEDRVTGRWGGADRLYSPEHFTINSVKATIKVPYTVVREEPFYVWRQTVKVIKKPKTRIYIEPPTPGIKFDRKYKEDVPAVGTTANYAPGHLLAREHGLYSAGVALNQDRLRIYVNGGNDNADDNDPHVIARAYGSLLRNKLIRRSLTTLDYDNPNHCAPREAWERGWDTFIACAILKNAHFIDKTFLGQEIPAHTFDLDLTYQKLLSRYKTQPETLDRDFGLNRGIDSPSAMSMMFYQVYKDRGPQIVNHAITFGRGGGETPAGRYIDPSTLLTIYPDMRETFEVLGLIPKLMLKFPDQGVQTLNTAYPKLEWDTNSMVLDLDRLECTLVIAEDRPENVVRRIPGIKGQSFDFGQVINPEDAAVKLAEKFEGRKVYYWRIEIAIDDGPLQYKCTSPWGAFEIEIKTQVIKQSGGTVDLEAAASPLRQYGKLIVPEGGLAGDTTMSAQFVKLARDQGDFDAVHGKAFELSADNIKFLKPATLEFGFNDKDLAGRDPRGLGIYRFNPAEKKWDYIGGKLGQGVVRADIDHNSLYALLYDKRGPEFQNVTDSPDHAFRRDTLTIGFELRKPTLTTLVLTDSAGKPVRKLIDNQLFAGTKQEFSLALADLPEGRYLYTLSGADEGGRKAESVTRGFLVSDAVRGMVQGRVSIKAGAPPAALRVFIPDTSLEFRSEEGEGSFVLSGVAPGKYDVLIHRPGLFPEKTTVEIQAGQTADVGEIRLTDQVIGRAALASEIFTPNNAGQNEYAVLQLQALRPCTIRVRAVDANDKVVATLADKRELGVGESTVLWRGNDDSGKPLPSGWYTLDVMADALGMWIPAAKVKVLLDRGLVRECLPLPRIFSPNGDGFEDDVQITYLLENEAIVTVEIRDAQDRIIAVPARDVRQPVGPNAITWDGKTADGKFVANGRFYYHVMPNYVTGHPSRKVIGAFIADCTAPEILDLTPQNGQKLTDSRPVITAKVRPDAGVEASGLRFKLDENTIAPDSFDPKTGVFSFRPRTALGEGVHIAIAYARNLAFNDAPPKAVSFTIDKSTKEKKYIDTEPPLIKLQTPQQDQTVYTPTPLITALLSDEGSGIDDKNIVVHLDGERVCNNVKMFLPGKSGKDWDWYSYEKAIILYDPLLGEMRFVPGSPLAPGKHHVRLEVMDRQGNAAKAAEGVFNVVIDKQPPKLTDFAPADGSISATAVEKITATIVDEGPAGLDPQTLRLLVDGRPAPGDLATMYDPKTSVFSYPLTQPLSTGSQHQIVLTVRDRAGNASEVRANIVTLVNDTSPPRIDVYSPRSGQTMTGGRLTAAVYDVGLAGIDESSLRLGIDGQLVSRSTATTNQASATTTSTATTTPAAGPATRTAGYTLRDGVLDMALPKMPPGAHRISLFVRDRAGNASREAVISFNVSAQEDAR